MRALASIERVATVSSIPEADTIEVITMESKGWKCVVKKGLLKPGDFCVYHEVDSLLPDKPQYSFLSRGSKLKKCIIENGTEVEGYRLKTVCLRGQISQGLALPLTDFAGIIPDTCEVGTDVTTLLGVNKFEPPIPIHLAGEMKGLYPGFLSKTDELRIQADTSILDKLRGKRLYATSKIDGTSSSFYKYENELGVCGHKWEFKENDKTIFWHLARMYNLKERFPDGYAAQGETAGESIQHNRIKLKGVDFYCFYVIDIKTGQYLKLDDMLHFLKEVGLKSVPVITDNFILDHTVDELLAMADAPSPLNPKEIQEGTVYRLYDSTEKVSFKVISNAYLIKWGL
jgi:RNA ligase (TIGR02306 family)